MGRRRFLHHTSLAIANAAGQPLRARRRRLVAFAARSSRSPSARTCRRSSGASITSKSAPSIARYWVRISGESAPTCARQVRSSIGSTSTDAGRRRDSSARGRVDPDAGAEQPGRLVHAARNVGDHVAVGRRPGHEPRPDRRPEREAIDAERAPVAARSRSQADQIPAAAVVHHAMRLGVAQRGDAGVAPVVEAQPLVVAASGRDGGEGARIDRGHGAGHGRHGALDRLAAASNARRHHLLQLRQRPQRRLLDAA